MTARCDTHSFTHLKSLIILPLQLPIINNTLIKREYFIKLLGVILDENLSWKNNIKLLENKMAKNVGIIFRPKFIINKIKIRIYYTLIHRSYINYDNLTLVQQQTKLAGLDKHTLQSLTKILRLTRNCYLQPEHLVSKKSFTLLVAKRNKTVFRICLNNFCERL